MICLQFVVAIFVHRSSHGQRLMGKKQSENIEIELAKIEKTTNDLQKTSASTK